jgi:quinol monooxygenase YgiN
MSGTGTSSHNGVPATRANIKDCAVRPHREEIMHRLIRGLLLLACLFTWPAMAGQPGPIIVVTHIDVIPNEPGLTQAISALKQFAADSKHDPGVLRFDLITWTPTTNHFQLIEVYSSLEAFNRHVEAAHTIAFRSAIQTAIGAPYDERVYTVARPEHDDD